MAEFEGCPDWCILPEMIGNVTNENQNYRRPKWYPDNESSSSSIEVFDNYETYDMFAADLRETLFGNLPIEKDDKDISEREVPLRFTENKETAPATEGGLMMCYGGAPNSQITTSIDELKEENKLLREELSNYKKKENSAMDLMLQKLVEKFEEQSLLVRKEFDELKEQVKNVKTEIKMIQGQISGGSDKLKADAPKLSQELLSSHLGKFTDMVSSLCKQIFSQDNKSREKILDEKVSSSASVPKARDFVMSDCFQSFKSYRAAFLQKVDECFAELLRSPLPDAEINKNMKIVQDLLVKLQNVEERMKITKEKEMVSS